MLAEQSSDSKEKARLLALSNRALDYFPLIRAAGAARMNPVNQPKVAASKGLRPDSLVGEGVRISKRSRHVRRLVLRVIEASLDRKAQLVALVDLPLNTKFSNVYVFALDIISRGVIIFEPGRLNAFLTAAGVHCVEHPANSSIIAQWTVHAH